MPIGLIGLCVLCFIVAFVYLVGPIFVLVVISGQCLHRIVERKNSIYLCISYIAIVLINASSFFEVSLMRFQ